MAGAASRPPSGSSRPRPTRDELLDTPRSGARPLGGSSSGGASSASSGSSRRSSGSLPGGGSSRRSPSGGSSPSAAAGSSSASPPAQQPAAPSGSSPPPPAGGGWRERVTRTLETPSGILVAAFVYPLLMNLLRGGPHLMWAWVKAKFINQATPQKEGGGGKP